MQKKLTIALANNAELPTKGDYIIRDVKTPGLGLRIYASGKRSWIFQKKQNGKIIRIVLGDIYTIPLESKFDPKTGETSKGARQLANEASLMVNQGLDPRLEKKRKIQQSQQILSKDSLTVKFIWDEYVKHKQSDTKIKQLKDRTIKDLNNTRAKLAESLFWHLPVSELTGLMLAKDIQRQTKAAKSNTASNGGMTQASLTLRYLRAAYNYAIVAYKLHENHAFKELNKLSPGWQNTRAKNRRLGETEDELKDWWAAIDELRCQGNQDKATIADWLKLSVFFGTRANELLSLEWKNVDLVNNVIVLPEDSTKSNRQHVIPLTKHVRSIIQLRFDENNARPQSNHDGKEFGKSQWVFLSSRKSSKTGLYSHIVSPHKAIKKIRAQTGIEFSPHDLRRTFATLLNERGVSNITIEKALNHAPSSIAAKSYVNNPRLSKLRKVYQELEDAILVEAGVNQAQKDLVEISKDEYEEFLKYKNTLKTPNIDTTHI